MKFKLTNIVAVCLLLICGLSSFVNYNLMPDFSENRVLKKFPNSMNADFPRGFSDFISDNFLLRKPLMSLFFKIKIKLFNSDLGLPISIGEDGWVFIREEIPFHQKTVIPDQILLDKIRNSLDAWCSYSNQHGAKFYFLIGPNKSTIYPEKMNSRFLQLNNESFIDQIKRQNYQCEFEILDVRELLINNKEHNLYYKWGTHWNDFAGSLVWNKIKSDILKSEPKIIWPTTPKTELTMRPAHPLEDSVWGWFGQSDPNLEQIPLISYQNSNQPIHTVTKNEIKVFAIGDSFLQYMFNSAKVVFPSYLSFNLDSENVVFENLNRDSNAWLVKAYGEKLKIDPIDLYKPNVVIFESVERNLHSVGDIPRPANR